MSYTDLHMKVPVLELDYTASANCHIGAAHLGSGYSSSKIGTLSANRHNALCRISGTRSNASLMQTAFIFERDPAVLKLRNLQRDKYDIVL
jgi:hypothetical protein